MSGLVFGETGGGAPRFPLPEPPRIPSNEVNLRAFAAVEGGQELNTAAFASAIAAAHAAGGGRVVVPPGVWLTGPIHFRDRIELHLEDGAEIRFSQNPGDYLPVVFMQRGGVWCYTYSPFLYGRDCEDVAVTGRGTLNGQGQSWWPWAKNQPGMVRLPGMAADRTPVEERVFGTVEDGVRPSFLQFLRSRRVLLEGVRFIDSPSWTLHPVQCEDLTIRGVTVKNPASGAPNTDGIDPDACRRVLIEHCHVDTGDDGICLKSGWNEEGWDAGIPCEDVLIRHCTVLSAHGGLVIGSDLSGGIRNVHAHDCVFDGTDIGVRVKTKTGRGGFVQNVVAERLTLRNIRHQAVLITQWYNNNPHDRTAIDPSLPLTRIEDVTVRDVTCEGAAEAVQIRGMTREPFRRITLERLDITAETGIHIEATEDLQMNKVTVRGRSNVEA